MLFKIENGTASTLRVGNTRVRVRVFTSASFQVAAVDRNRLEGLRSQTLRLNPGKHLYNIIIIEHDILI